MTHTTHSHEPHPTRRGFFDRLASWSMFAGLVAGYGTLAAFAVRYLFPARPEPRAWLFAARIDAMRPGDSLPYVTPTGESVLITRQGEGRDADAFIALSSTCPHLGCKVHWEGPHDRFFCPCHNGTFDPQGKATGGPPLASGQALPRFKLKTQDGLLYIEVPMRGLSLGTSQRV